MKIKWPGILSIALGIPGIIISFFYVLYELYRENFISLNVVIVLFIFLIIHLFVVLYHLGKRLSKRDSNK